MDYLSQWCPVCDRQIDPKRTQIPATPFVIPPAVRKKQRGFLEGTGAGAQLKQKPRMRTVIEQGPAPLYCSEHCKILDISSGRDAHDERYPTYALYPYSTDNTSPSDVESISTSSDSLPSPTDEFPARRYSPFKPSPSAPTSSPSFTHAYSAPKSSSFLEPDFLPLVPTRRPYVTADQRSKSFQYEGSCSSSAPTPKHSSSRSPSSLPNNTDELLSKFSSSFSRRSESRVSLYNSPPTHDSPLSASPPRRTRRLLAQGTESKLALPDVLIRVSSTSSVNSRPTASRRNSSTSVMTNSSRTGSMNSMGSTSSFYSHSRPSPLRGSSSDDSDADDDYSDMDEPKSPASLSGYPLQRPKMTPRSWSNDNFRTVTSKPRTHRPSNLVPDGKRLFLFPTD